MLKLIYHEESEKTDMVRTVYELIEIQQEREQVSAKLQDCQRRMKKTFDRKAIERYFYP